MNELQQIEQQAVSYEPALWSVSTSEQSAEEAIPATELGVGTTGKAVSGLLGKLPWKRKSRAIPHAVRLKGFQARAEQMEANGYVLPGKILDYGSDETLKDRRRIFFIECCLCGQEDTVRADNFWRQNQACSSCAAKHRDDQIEKVINVIGYNAEDLAKAMELGSLPSQDGRGSYRASREEIYAHFGLVAGGNNAKGSSAIKALIIIAWAVKYAASRIQCRWKESTWARLGEDKVFQVAKAVRDFGLKWAARLCDGCEATARVCYRWVFQNCPPIVQAVPENDEQVLRKLSRESGFLRPQAV